ncbi:MAG TPA: hypothetical protein PKD05_24425 [Candidatus Melainabacteria bacterium]|nr:hypothetical protein [Candidatus Melainabacteria bacterium]
MTPHNRNIWEEKIADLRRYDLDELDPRSFDPTALESWPLPDLTFVRIDGVLRSWDIEREKNQASQNPQNQNEQDPSKPPKRMYLMEDALTGLHSQKANLAFAVIGNKEGVKYYMGVSIPGDRDLDTSEDENVNMVSFTSLRSILHSVYNGVDICDHPFDSEEIKSMIAPQAKYTGLVTGIPALKSTAGDTMESEQIERLAQGLQGHEFGFMVLAIPIPNTKVSKEEFLIVDQIQGLRRTKTRRRSGESNIIWNYRIPISNIFSSAPPWGNGLPERSISLRIALCSCVCSLFSEPHIPMRPADPPLLEPTKWSVSVPMSNSSAF